MHKLDREKADSSPAKQPVVELGPPESVGTQTEEKTARLQKTVITQNR